MRLLIGELGGNAAGEEAGGSDGTLSDSFVGCVAPVDCAHADVSLPDVTTTSDVASDAAVTCTQLGRNTFNNGPNCSMSSVQQCGNGHTYEASCSCQAGYCFCQFDGNPPRPDQMYKKVPLKPPACPSSCSMTPEEAMKGCGYPF
jgi:hypothetical protein